MPGKTFWRRLPTAVIAFVPLLALLGQEPTQRPDDKGPVAVPAKELNLDGDKETKIEGKLTGQDPKDKVYRKSPCHIYEVKLLEGVYYKIDLKSDDFDSFLRLENGQGNKVASDDNGGAGLNARILFKGTNAESLRIVATNIDGKEGTYVLTVKKASAQEAQHFELLVEATRLNAETGKLYQQGKAAAAIPLARKALAIYQKVLGEEHAGTAASLNNLGMLLQAQGDYAGARSSYEQALAIAKKVLGERHPGTAATLNNLGSVLQAQGNYAAARPCFEQAVDICKKALGEDPKTATSLDGLGSLLRLQGDYAAARSYYEQALAMRKKVLGEQHFDTATSLNNLGSLFQIQGDYAAARPCLEQALAIYKKALGEQHPYTATALVNLASLLRTQGDFVAARPYFEQGLAIFKKLLGEQHPNSARVLNSLGLLLQAQGDYGAARTYYEQALAINKKALGEQHPETATSLGNLGTLLQAQGDYAAARQYLEQALAINKKVLGEQHPGTATSLNNLGNLLQTQGDYAAARRHYEQTLAIFKKVLGEQHPSTGTLLNNLGILLQDQGDYAAARPYNEQALAICKKALGKQHPHTAKSLDNLGFLLQGLGDSAAARPCFEQALTITRDNLDLAAAGQSERQQFVMAKALRHHLDHFMVMARDAKIPAEQVYAAALAGKGGVFLRQRQMRLVVRDRPELADLVKDLQSVSARLSHLTFAVPDPKKREFWQKQLADLTKEREKLERDLAKASREFREGQDLAKLTPADLRKTLPAGAVLVDFLEHQGWTPPAKNGDKAKSEPQLTAFIIRADGPVVQVDLKQLAPIAEAVEQWRTNLIQRRRLPAAKDPAVLLWKLVWAPLEEHLQGAKIVLISPDDVLGRMPFAALPGKDPEKYLLEDVALSVLPVPRLLPALLATPDKEDARKRPASLLLVGAVDYDAAPAKTEKQFVAGKAPLQDRTGALLKWSPLEGTRGEILAIRDSFEKQFDAKGVTILRGDKATKSAVQQLASQHRFLHLATHGFFAPKDLKSALAPVVGDKGLGLLDISGDSFGRHGVTGWNPGLLSGVALAGANRKAEPDQDDGILTALGVMDLDLRGVDLAVLSACETGLGETAGGEGLLGLQRAFQVAGARSTVASLWKVDDRWTRELMERFYEYRWSKNMSTQEALRQAQLWVMREGPKRGLDFDNDKKEQPPRSAPPFYWAAFVLSGDWR